MIDMKENCCRWNSKNRAMLDAKYLIKTKSIKTETLTNGDNATNLSLPLTLTKIAVTGISKNASHE